MLASCVVRGIRPGMGGLREGDQADPERAGGGDGEAPRAGKPYAELGHKVLAAAPVMILVLDVHGVILYVNPFFERLTGYRLDEVLGKDWFDTFVPERERERRRASLRQAYLGERPTDRRGSILTRSGEARMVEWTGELLRDEGAPSGLLVIGHDVTERERAEEAARRSSELLRNVVAGAPIVLFALDREGTFQVSEGRALAKLGVPPGQLVGRSALELYGHVPGFREAFQRVLSGDQVIHASSEVDLEFEAVYTPSFDAHGVIDGVIGVVFDVTERKRAEAGLRTSAAAQEQLVEELREADRRKNDFIAMLSHELRNPLSAIRSGLYLIDRAVPGGEQARRASTIVDRQVDQLARLVDDLLDVSRITQHKVNLKTVPLDLGELVRSVVEDHQALFTSHGVRLETRLAGEPVFVEGDAARLTQVIGNLIHNAIKFTPAGGLTTVTVVRDLAGERAVLHVADTGAGIDPTLIERLFEPFTQADRTLARSGGGLGLGLALVKGLVQLHGGDVSVRSEGEGRGAEFVVRLPLARRTEREAMLPTCTTDPRTARRVLVIEDNVDAAEVLSAILELDGHTVDIAHDGLTGIRMARDLLPDIVLCDLGLPGASGYDVARELRRDDALRATPLIALSGYAATEDVERARAAGFDQHLPKPVELDLLRSVVERSR
ncbi:MAG: signal transduction histidine kinase [Deltaproteobacteria bacterium]|nr:signal transduction histidine kinase [Deltaproteobacteria bacterium]